MLQNFGKSLSPNHFEIGSYVYYFRLHKELPKAGPPEGKPMPKKNLRRP
jgi:hypothetical protein